MKEETAKDKKDDGKDKKEDPKEKLSKKHLELLEKRKEEEEAKIKSHDADQLKTWEKSVDDLEKVMDLEKFEKELLDLLCGYQRITDSFAGFAVLHTAFKTTDAQAKLVVKVVKAIRNALKKMQLDRLAAEQQGQARKLVRYFFCIIQEAFNSYGKNDL